MSKGAITTYVLVFGSLALVMIGGVFNFILFQLKQGSERIAWNQSLQIAESGLHYYQWCLNNEVTESCLTEKDYYDLEGNLKGSFSLEINTETSCGENVKTTINSTGWTNDFPNLQREVAASYAKISVAQYAYLLNDNVWAGSDREIRGFYHSNGGIRMDGENQSLVTSFQETWLCTSSFGCDYSDCPDGCSREGNSCQCPGVFTTTENSSIDLFEFPSTYFDFESITIDLAQIKGLTEPFSHDKYWPPVINIDSSGDGYHLKLQSNGHIEVWIITDLEETWGYNQEEGWHYDYFNIDAEYFYKTISLDPSCSLIFVEDNLWIDGDVNGKVTIVSANLINPTNEANVVLPGNIEYVAVDGSDGLAIVGQGNVLISPGSPDNMELEGIFVAQKGRFGRNHYSDNIKTKLEIYGSVVSNNRVGTKWSSGGQIVSGYLTRENYTDSNMIYNPPPFVPAVSSDFKILEWEEVE